MKSVNVKAVFGGNVRRLRKAKGFSQEELADRAGCHRTYIGSIERGERNLSLLNIVAIASALDVPIAALFHGILQTT